MKKIAFTVPTASLQAVKEAMFSAGAGKYENYSKQCWQTLGQAEFLPLEGSNPAIGSQGELETVREYKVEMYCVDECVDAAIDALKRAHPYEGPQFEVYGIDNSLTIDR